MPQGKLKAKAKLPKAAAAKKKAKGKAVTKRANAPITPRKAKAEKAAKLKKVITKAVNATAEAELRAVALGGQKGSPPKKGTRSAAGKKKK